MIPPPSEDHTLHLPLHGRRAVRSSSDAARPAVRYRVLGEIARGGMGAVLRVHDPDLDRVLALKVLLSEHLHHPEMHRRFLEEARITSRLQHPGIVPVHDIGTFADDRPFFTMKLVEGRTFAALLQDRTSPADELTRHLATYELLCQTVAYAHSQSVIHRDLKPANVMVGAFGEVQVMDWGVAKVLRPEDFREPVEDAAAVPSTVANAVIDQTMAGSVVGTPAYMAPEQARGEPLDERADVFGLGAILCEVLTGKPPFTVLRSSSVFLLNQDRDLDAAHDRLERCGADRELIDLARDCLAELPQDRPANAGELVRRLIAYRTGVQERLRQAELARAAAAAREDVAHARRAAERRARRLMVGLATVGGLLALLVVLVGWWYADRRRANDQRIEALLDGSRRVAERAEALTGDPALERWREAVALLDQAHEAAQSGPVSAGLVGVLESERTTARREVTRREADRRFSEALFEVRLKKEDRPDRTDTDIAYAHAFAHHGLDFATRSDEALAEAVLARSPALVADVIAALDDWAVERRRGGRSEAVWKRPMRLALRLDGDPWRQELRRRVLDDGRRPTEAAGLIADVFTPPGMRVGMLWEGALVAHRRDYLRRAAATADAAKLVPASAQLLAGVLAQERLEREAVDLLRAAHRRHPDDVWLNHDLGQLLSPIDLREAVRYLTAARALRPEVGHALAHALEASGRRDEAIELFRDLIRLRPDSPDHRTCYGRMLITMGKADEGLRELEKAVQLGPGLSSTRAGLAGALLSLQKDLSRARDLLLEAIALQPGSASLQVDLAKAYHQMGQPALAEAAIQRALVLSPSNEDALVQKGLMLQEQHRGKEARAVLDRLMQRYPNNLEGLLQRANLAYRTGRFSEAHRDLLEAVRLRPGSERALALLGMVLNSMDRPAEAVPHLRRAHALAPGRVDALTSLVAALVHSGQPAEAITLIRGVAVVPANATLRYNVGNAHLMLRQYSDAVAWYRRALEVDSSYAEAHCNMGHALRDQGRFAESLAALERGHSLGQKRGRSWRYPSEAWVKQARRLVGVEKQVGALADGSLVPGDPSDYWQAARASQCRGLHATRARLLVRAIGADPTLPNDPRRFDRVSAAGSAVLAGVARSRDAVLLTEKERAQMRALALAWLTDEVADLLKRRQSTPPARKAAEEALANLLRVPELAGAREPGELARLPDGEQARWRTLWRRVRDEH